VLVLDSSVVVVALATEDGLKRFEGDQLHAPPLMWSEAMSAIHEAMWRRDIDEGVARTAFERLLAARIHRSRPRGLAKESWRLADKMGWAKTYDVEYVALASLLGCRLVTMDGRLRRATESLGFVVGPTDL
jgi:predicted nucleic acid-binding protein